MATAEFETNANQLMVDCARHCCICRHYRPLHLQVHHIKEKADCGRDDADNLIAVCIICHSDTHTETKLTRRFRPEELKMHRDAVIKLVKDGRLPGINTDPSVPNMSPATLQSLWQQFSTPLSKKAEELLLGARGAGRMTFQQDIAEITIGDKTKDLSNDRRAFAEYEAAISQLMGKGMAVQVPDKTPSLYLLSLIGFSTAEDLALAKKEREQAEYEDFVSNNMNLPR